MGFLKFLESLKFFVSEGDYTAVKNLSDDMMHEAAVSQDKLSIRLAVMSHALADLMENLKEEFEKEKERILVCLERAIDALKRKDLSSFESQISDVMRAIYKIDRKFPTRVESVLREARLMKGEKLYEKGVSLGRVADILGITAWELSERVGKKEVEWEEKELGKRLKFAMEFFGV